MDNETQDISTPQVTEPEVETTETIETEVETPKPAKPRETLEQQAARLQRELKRTRQKLGITEEDVEDERSTPKHKPFTLDRADKAFLIAKGLQTEEEWTLAKEYVQNTGKELEEVVDSRYFQKELTEMRQTRESKMAIDAVSGSKRGLPSARDTVDYWLAKGVDELPPAYMSDLRRQVVNARAKQYSNNSPFKN